MFSTLIVRVQTPGRATPPTCPTRSAEQPGQASPAAPARYPIAAGVPPERLPWRPIDTLFPSHLSCPGHAAPRATLKQHGWTIVAALTTSMVH